MGESKHLLSVQYEIKQRAGTTIITGIGEKREIQSLSRTENSNNGTK